MKWISVKNGLPEDGVWVLVHIDGCVIETAMYSDRSKDFQNGYEWLNDVTHWMPLPAPPTL